MTALTDLEGSPGRGTGPFSIPAIGRILGRIRGPRPGPTLLAVGGLHGNEPAGVLALVRVFEKLAGREEQLSGELVGLAGNRRALAAGRRYLSRDLNRSWTPSGLQAVRGSNPPRGPEDEEQLDLLAVIERVGEEARGPLYFLDLHTTSGPGPPFLTIMDSLKSRRFAVSMAAPLVVGLGEQVDGTLLGYLASRGVAGVVFEGGKRDDPRSVETSEAAIWLALASTGVIEASAFPQVAESRALLESETGGLPRTFELTYRHPVAPGDGFAMLPGLESFRRVGEGEVLARDRRGAIRAPRAGRLLMPLYQRQGEDGFFLIREFHPFWLHLSAALRRLRADRLLPWFPGIRRVEGTDGALVVNRKLARWFTLEVLHLLGYRREVEEEDRLVVLKQAG